MSRWAPQCGLRVRSLRQQAAALVDDAGAAFADALNTTMAAGAVVAVLSGSSCTCPVDATASAPAAGDSERSVADVTGGITT